MQKLTGQHEQQIIRLLASGELSVRSVAERFAVGQSTIHRIKKKYRPPSAPTASKARVRRHHRAISPLRRQWLFHLLDMRSIYPTYIAELARKFDVPERVIREAIAARKKLCRTAPYEHSARAGGWDGKWRKESESEP
jgi:transposase